jgi:hypothetical protein
VKQFACGQLFANDTGMRDTARPADEERSDRVSQRFWAITNRHDVMLYRLLPAQHHIVPTAGDQDSG